MTPVSEVECRQTGVSGTRRRIRMRCKNRSRLGLILYEQYSAFVDPVRQRLVTEDVTCQCQHTVYCYKISCYLVYMCGTSRVF